MKKYLLILFIIISVSGYSEDFGIGREDNVVDKQTNADLYITTWDGIIRSLNNDIYSSIPYLYKIRPSPALCIKGELTDLAKNRALDMLNNIRDLHNLKRLKYSKKYDSQVQAGALILQANGILTHTPPKSSRCFTEEGYLGTSTSNIYGGKRGIGSRDAHDPLNDVIGWIHDTYNVNDKWQVGHRRWDLDPFRTYMTYGQVYWASLDKVHSFNEEKEITVDPKDIPDFVAFPYERYPYILFPTNNDRYKTYWSFQIIEDKTNKYNNKHYYFTINHRESPLL